MRCIRAVRLSVFSIATVLLVAPHALGAQGAPPLISTEIVIQHDVPMKTRDGVILYADIYRPKSSDRFPVILMRTPYDKSVNWTVSPVFKMVPRGYVVIIQDVRGRYTSEGEWYPFKHEQADGFDTVETTCWFIRPARCQATWKSLAPSLPISSSSPRPWIPTSRRSSSTSRPMASRKISPKAFCACAIAVRRNMPA
jgi:hypothetical protein